MNLTTCIASLALAAAVPLCACDSRSGSNAPADNTARNAGDHASNAKTPMDQSQSSDGIDVTAAIRRAIMQDSSMSMNAQNCKIITDTAGTITLRGVVNSQKEKDAIEAKARSVAASAKIVNELEVKAN